METKPESSILKGNSSNEHNCDGLLNRVLSVSESDMRDLIEKDPEWKIRRVNEIISSKDEFDEFCAPNYDREIRNSLLSRFDFALLKLATSIKKDGNIYDANIQNFLSRYSEAEFKAINDLESFTGLDALDPKLIKEAMERKEGRISETIKEWYNKQMYAFNDLIDASPQNLMRNTIKRALLQKYDSRFETIKKGILEYISKDPVAPAKLFNEYEGVINHTYEAQIEWDKIIKEFGGVNINEIERKNERLESLEFEAEDKISRIEDEYMRNSDITNLIRQEDELYETLYREFGTVQSEINQKLDEISKIMDKANNIIRSIELKSQAESDLKVKTIYDAQKNYMKSIIDGMNESKFKLNDIEETLSTAKLRFESKKNDIKTLIENPAGTNTIRIDEAEVEAINLSARFEKRLKDMVPFKIEDTKTGIEIKINSHSQLDKFNFDFNPVSDGKVYSKILIYDFSKTRFLRLGKTANVALCYAFLLHSNFRLSKDGVPIMDNHTFTLSELLYVLGEISKPINTRNTTVYLLMASPTGYDSRIIDYLKGNHKLYTMDIYLYLIDLKTHTLYSNRLIEDETISKLFKMELEGETESYYREVIEKQLKKFEMYSIQRIAQENNLDLKQLEKVAQDMKSDKKIDIVNIDGVPAVKRR